MNPAVHSERLEASLSEKDSAKAKGIDGTNEDHTARLVRAFVHPQHVRSSTQGSLQILPHSNEDDSGLLVGYGINPVVTEFSSDGSVLCDMHFGSAFSWETGNVQSYRAYKFPWTGAPRYPPSTAIRRNAVYASWNGATAVREWLLQSSDSLDGEWNEVIKVAKTGFETAIPLSASNPGSLERYIRILAIDESGRICEKGVSRALDRSFLGRLPLQANMSFVNGNSMLVNVGVFCAVCVAVLAFFARLLRRRRSRQYGKTSYHAD